MDCPHSLFVISAPSGAGKTTLVANLLKQDSQLQLSISTTTRLPRGNEQNGVDYFFVNEEQFLSMQQQNAFVESANVHGHFYGTSQKWLENTLKTHDVLLEIDVQGAAQIKKTFPQSVLIFILPPSLQELEKRLKNRATDSIQVIEQRLKNALTEMQQVDCFDYVIMNKHLSHALKELESIVQAQRCRTFLQKQRHTSFFQALSFF